MDPLSVTSGIVGILAFAFQLAKTASKIRTAVEEMKSAPKGARDLIDRLAMLQIACELITMNLERRNVLPNHPLPPSLELVSKALSQFLAKAQELEQTLSTLTSSNGSTRTLRPKSDTARVSRLQLVLRKDRISTLVQEIEHVSSLLQFVIQVDMWTTTSIPPQLPSLSSNETELVDDTSDLGRASSMTLKDSAPSPYPVALTARRTIHQQHRTFRYFGCITWTTSDGWVEDDENYINNRIAYRKGCISFRPPRASTEFNMCYDGGMGTPSYALKVTHIIEWHSELGLRLRRFMRHENDVGEFQKMFSKRELSIYSVVRGFDQETNLFFMAVSARWAKGCRYLLQNDFRHEFKEANTPSLRFWRNDLAGACEVTEILLSARPPDVLETDMKYLLDIGTEPHYFARYLKVFLKSCKRSDDNLLPWAWKCLVHNIFRYSAVFDWIPPFRYLIDRGIDMHQPCGPYKSAYMQVLCEADHPLEADKRSYSWLEMLKACDVDLATYIDTEMTIIEKFGFHSFENSREKKAIILDLDGLRMPSWRWELSSDSSITEVLGEFPHLGIEFLQFGPEKIRLELIVNFKRWKLEEAYTQWADYCFPFLLCPIDVIWRANDYLSDERWRLKLCGEAIEIRDKRIAQREAKKWRKARRREKQSSDKIPGTWVD